MAPLILGMILMLIQLSLFLFANHALHESLSAGARKLYFNSADTAGAMSTVRDFARERYIDPDALQLTVTKMTSPYAHLELKAVYPFEGIGVGLFNGPVQMTSTLSVALAD